MLVYFTHFEEGKEGGVNQRKGEGRPDWAIGLTGKGGKIISKREGTAMEKKKKKKNRKPTRKRKMFVFREGGKEKKGAWVGN